MPEMKSILLSWSSDSQPIKLLNVHYYYLSAASLTFLFLKATFWQWSNFYSFKDLDFHFNEKSLERNCLTIWRFQFTAYMICLDQASYQVLAFRCGIYPCRGMSTHFPSVYIMRSNDLYVIDDPSLDQWDTQNNPSYFSGNPGVILDLHTFSVCLQVVFVVVVVLCACVWFFF